jgi:hypothetical protein
VARRLGSAGGAVLLVAYGWWLSGVTAFTTASYLAVALPVVAVVAAALVPRPAGVGGGPARVSGPEPPAAHRLTLAGTAPWLAVVAAAVALEVVGLALGGRSTVVPTLSTVVDRATNARFDRFVFCCAWLGLGALAAWRSRPGGSRR